MKFGDRSLVLCVCVCIVCLFFCHKLQGGLELKLKCKAKGGGGRGRSAFNSPGLNIDILEWLISKRACFTV